MFEIDTNSVRPRRTNNSAWFEAYNDKLAEVQATFRVLEEERKREMFPPKFLENESKLIVEKSTRTRRPTCRTFYKNVEEYCANSTLHGLRYVGDASISFGERLFWLIAFCSAIAFAAYFITALYEKYNMNPVIISLNPTATHIGNLPFPAITICSMNQAKKSEAELIMQSGTEIEKLLLDDYCNSNTTFSNISTIGDEATKWENVQKFILRVNPSCQEMLKVCIWKQDELLCEELFNSALTDDGLCCTFNALPRGYIYRNPREMSGLNLTFPSDVDDWSPERGYSPNATALTLPWRAGGAGTHLGLTVVLDAQIKWYYCSSAIGIGFKVLLHNPLESPKMADFALLVSPGLEARIVIVPKIFDASQNLRHIDIKKRMCYFSSERELQFYRQIERRTMLQLSFLKI